MSDTKVTLSLKSLISNDKFVEVEYPGLLGFKLNLRFLSREDLVAIRKKATGKKFHRGAVVEELNDELFLQLYTKGCIKGWSGLKLEYLDKLAPVNLEGQNLEDTLAYDEENAIFLMRSSSEFDSYISEMVTTLANFPQSSGSK